MQACHELLLWTVPQLDGFPRVRRFTLGERLESTLIEVLECLVEAAYTRARQGPLKKANLRLEVARHLWRLSHELEVVSSRRYEKDIGEIGRKRRLTCVWRGCWTRHTCNSLDTGGP